MLVMFVDCVWCFLAMIAEAPRTGRHRRARGTLPHPLPGMACCLYHTSFILGRMSTSGKHEIALKCCRADVSGVGWRREGRSEGRLGVAAKQWLQRRRGRGSQPSRLVFECLFGSLHDFTIFVVVVCTWLHAFGTWFGRALGVANLPSHWSAHAREQESRALTVM